MQIAEPSFSSTYDADLGEQPGTGARAKEQRTLQTAWADLDPTPWEQVADKAAAAAAVRRYHDALVAINKMNVEEREAALASIGDLSGQDLYTMASRVEAAAGLGGTSARETGSR